VQSSGSELWSQGHGAGVQVPQRYNLKSYTGGSVLMVAFRYDGTTQSKSERLMIGAHRMQQARFHSALLLSDMLKLNELVGFHEPLNLPEFQVHSLLTSSKQVKHERLY
jgi:hypothetical protein